MIDMAREGHEEYMKRKIAEEEASLEDFPPSFDNVNNPLHYNKGGVECIDAIRAALGSELFQGYCNGNTIKYLWRHRYKGKPLEDLRKAQFYLERLILEQENEQDDS